MERPRLVLQMVSNLFPQPTIIPVYPLQNIQNISTRSPPTGYWLTLFGDARTTPPPQRIAKGCCTPVPRDDSRRPLRQHLSSVVAGYDGFANFDGFCSFTEEKNVKRWVIIDICRSKCSFVGKFSDCLERFFRMPFEVGVHSEGGLSLWLNLCVQSFEFFYKYDF